MASGTRIRRGDVVSCSACGVAVDSSCEECPGCGCALSGTQNMTGAPAQGHSSSSGPATLSGAVAGAQKGYRFWVWFMLVGIGITIWSFVCSPLCRTVQAAGLTVEHHAAKFVRSDVAYRHVDTMQLSPGQWLYDADAGVWKLAVLAAGPIRVEYYDRRPAIGESLGSCLAKMAIRSDGKHRVPTFIYTLTSTYRFKDRNPTGDELQNGTLWARWKPIRDDDGRLPEYAYPEDTGWVLVELGTVSQALWRPAPKLKDNPLLPPGW